MKHYRRTTSCWLISQALCFCLLLQGSGIAQALPLPPKKTFVSRSELETAHRERVIPDSDKPGKGHEEAFFDQAWSLAEDFHSRPSGTSAGSTFLRWFQAPWAPASLTADNRAPTRVAQAGGLLPLPPRLMSAFLASSSRSQAGPPSPPGLGTEPLSHCAGRNPPGSTDRERRSFDSS